MKDQFYYFKLEWRNYGLDYAARFHSHWIGINDPEFHKLKQKYIEIANQIEDYVGYSSEGKL